MKVVNFYKHNLATVLLIAVICFTGYFNGLGGHFVSADDIPGIVQNKALLNFGEVAKTLNLLSIIYSALVNIFGMNSLAFHTTALILHILNTLLVLLLAHTMFGKRPAFYASLIFALLPAGSEAVFWISGMGYLVQAFFTLLCLNCFFLFKTTKDRHYLFGSLGVYLLSLIVMPTPWMLVVPFVLASLDFFTRKLGARVKLMDCWYYLPLAAASLAFWFLRARVNFLSRYTASTLDYSFDFAHAEPLYKRLPYTVAKAFELYVFPLKLSLFHDDVLSTTVYVLMIGLTVIVITGLIYLMYHRSTYAGLLLAVFASIAPTLSPVQVSWFVAERYLYLGGAFFSMAAAVLLVKVDYRHSIKNLAAVLLTTLLVLYATRLFIRANDFKTNKSLWLATQKITPFSARVYNNLGDVYSNEQDWANALASFRQAITIRPDYFEAVHNLGYTYMLIGDYESAKKYLLESFSLNNQMYPALVKLSQIEKLQGNSKASDDYFEQARRINSSVSR